MLQYLEPYADIVVSSRAREAGEAGHGARFAPLSEVLACPIIIPSIPDQFFNDFFGRNAKLINPQAVVIDVCSVKQQPLEALAKWLPASCQILGTHPLFGPTTAAHSLENHTVVVCPVRIETKTYQKIADFCRELGMKVLERSPVEHDRDMAYVQGLSHYIGRLMELMQIPDTPLATRAYRDLLDMKRIQASDSWELFMSIMHENPHTAEVHRHFLTMCKELDQKIYGSQADR